MDPVAIANAIAAVICQGTHDITEIQLDQLEAINEQLLAVCNGKLRVTISKN